MSRLRRRPAPRHSALHIPRDPPRMGMPRQLALKLLRIEPEVLRIPQQVRLLERVLVSKEHIVHLPERALRARRLGGLRGLLGMRMDAGERKVPEHEAELVWLPREQLLYDAIRRAGIRALVVAVHHERGGGVPRASRGSTQRNMDPR